MSQADKTPPATGGPETEWIFDVDEKSFEVEVIERSRRTPVLVDFWAEWCRPCRVLGPLLEKIVRDHAGRIVLAKVNVEESGALAAGFGIQSIPTVIGIRDGKAVEEFIGLLSESEIREAVQSLLPSKADELARDAQSREEEDPGGAEALYRLAIETDGQHDRARVGLARLLVKRGADSEAREILDRSLFGGEDREEADRLRAILLLRQKAASFADASSRRARLEADPENAELRYELGCVLAATGEYREALEHLLRAAQADRTLARERVREVMVSVFHILGTGSDLAREYEGKLASALY